MNRRLLTVLLILVFLSSFASESYGCPDPPDISLIYSQYHVSLEHFDTQNRFLRAECSSGGPIENWVWTCPTAATVVDQTDMDYSSTIEFSFSTTGSYSFSVRGFDGNEQSDCDTAPFYVFEMDLNVSGVSDDDEEDPGKFLGEGDFVEISLAYEPSSLWPGYIELKIPYGGHNYTRVWSEDKGTLIIPNGRYLEKYYKMWLVGTVPSPLNVEGYSTGIAELWLFYSSSTDPDHPVYPCSTHGGDMVKFTVVAVYQVWINYAGSSWENVTGDTIVVLKGTEYTFKAYPDPSSASWPSGRPNWSGVASGTGETIDVTFDTAGTNTLTAKCGASDTGKTVTIKVVVPEPDQVSFVDYSSGEEHDIYGVSDPVWKRVSNPDNPASYTQDKHIKTQTSFWASDSLTYSTEVDVDVEGSGSFTFTEDTSVSFGTWPSGTTSHSSDGKITNSIGSTDFTFTWKYRPSGASSWITMANTSGTHKIYRVFGAPECGSSNYTKDNIDDAISITSGETTEPDIASKANDNVDNTVDDGCICGDGFQKNFDAAMGTYGPGDKGMCCCRAEGLDCVLNVLGIGPYTNIYCNEMPEASWATSTHQCAGSCTTHGPVLRAFRAAGIWNTWEGAIRSGGIGTIAYAPGGGPFEDDHDGIADNWTYRWHYGSGASDYCTGACTVTGSGGCSSHSPYWDRFLP